MQHGDASRSDPVVPGAERAADEVAVADLAVDVVLTE